MKPLYAAWNDNDPIAFAIALGLVVITLLAIVAIRFAASRVIGALSRRAQFAAGESAAQAIGATRLWLLLPLAVAVGAASLDLPARMDRVLHLLAVGGAVLQVGLWITFVIRDWVTRRTATHVADDGGAVTALALLGFAARTVVWTLILLFILDQMGFNITALVAGLGIGGIAVALAVQNILGDLFASLSIVLDKPFVVGDFIVVDSMRGKVERIGVKSTRLLSLDGEGLVFSNSELLKSRIRNFKRMDERRILFQIGVTYDTPMEQMRAIPGKIRGIIEARDKTRVDRVHFKEYGDSALVFETVYYVLDPAYNVYMDIQQDINLAILESFNEQGIEFAFPTRTLHIAGEAQAVEVEQAIAATRRANA